MSKSSYFGEIELSEKTVLALKEMGFEEPSPIQKQTVPVVMQGLDVIGQAQTGTGKTAAFGIPIVEKTTSEKVAQSLVLTPTRELAIQVAEEISKIAKYKGLRVVPIYGGQSIERQIKALKNGAQVIIGTPGRLLDHIRRGTIFLSKVSILVLDEADEMLDMGFIDDIETIIKSIQKENRQTLLFSATMPAPILSLTKKYMNNPKVFSISKEQLTVPLTDQFYCESKDKLEALCRILETEDMDKTIIFCRTKKGVDELVASLNTRGYSAESLHGDLSQAQRDKVMKAFRERKLEVLVATDVAARGLDISDVSHVINFDIPQDPESYVHRIGRTGRAGKSGIAITFITPREFRQLRLIEKVIRVTIRRKEVPSVSDMLDKQKDELKGLIFKIIKQENISHYIAIVEEMTEEFEPEKIAAAAIRLYQEGEPTEKVEVDREKLAKTGAKQGMSRLFINIGKEKNISKDDILNYICEEGDMKKKDIKNIRILDKFTFLEVPEEVSERIIAILHKSIIKGHRIHAEAAKPR